MGVNNLFRYVFILVIAVINSAHQAIADDRDFSLSSANFLVESGFLQHLLPRFSLNSGITIEVLQDGVAADVAFTTDVVGQPMMQAEGQIFSIVQTETIGDRAEKAQRFVDWLTSEVGRRTITQYTIDGEQVFTLFEISETGTVEAIVEGNVTLGASLALEQCGRCHVIGEVNRMAGIGSTPSFALLRSFPDWNERFATFYVRRPHPAITQIDNVTEPFDPAFPPTVQPLFLREGDLEAILAFVSQIEPADLSVE